MQKRLIWVGILAAYSAILIRVMVFRHVPVIRVGHMMFNFGGADANGQANFVPFKTILPYLLGYKGWVIAGVNLIGNVVLPVPIGFLAMLVYPNMTWKTALALAVAFGLIIEGMQMVFHLGIFDIDDVILNGLGVMIGYCLFRIIVQKT
jgi:glycopeptide antibiotics resistance protein